MTPRPHVLRYASAIDQLEGPIISEDYEFSIRTGEPSILGLTGSNGITVCTPFEEALPYLRRLIERLPEAMWLGHYYTGAEAQIRQRIGLPVRPEKIIDTIALHYLLNMHLCKAQKKAADDEEDVRGRGFMNLFAMCSLYTDADCWKSCVGEAQCVEEKRPCPEHDPFAYCGEDTYWPLQAYPKMQQVARMRGVDKLYPLHRDLLLTLQKVKERGVLVDVPYVDTLRTDFEAARAEIRAGFDFNPDSPPQVTKHFGLPDAQEETVRDAAEDAEEGSEILKLLEYKELGKGPDRWFAPRSFDYAKGKWKGYVDENGYIHCNLGIFTSTGRFNCTSPNLQNVAKRRKDRKTGESLGKRVRRAIIAPEGYYLVRADYKNAENVAFLTLAGYEDLPETDFHAYMRDMIGIKEDDPFALALGGAREAAKSVTHATDYFEGIKLVPREELRKPKMLREVSVGARIVFDDWVVFGKVVTFTGINLANRAFGDASYGNRKRALDVQMKYFAGFPKLRELQKVITTQVERERCVRPPTGYVHLSYGYEEDRLKTAAAMYGSNPVAQFIKYAMVRANHPRLLNVLSVHDELIFVASKAHSPQQIKSWVQDIMIFSLPEIPKMQLRIEVTLGDNWADQNDIK